MDPARPNNHPLNPATLNTITANLGNLVTHHQGIPTTLTINAKKLLDFLKKPTVRAVLLAAGVSFTTVFLLVASAGFNVAGIGAGSLAAIFQSAFYGGLTPGGSLFATLQSMGMLGTLLPVQVGIAGASAAVVSAIVWAFCRE